MAGVSFAGSDYTGPTVRFWTKGITGHVAILYDGHYFSARPDKADDPEGILRYDVEPIKHNAGGALSSRQKYRGLERNTMNVDGTPNVVLTPSSDITLYGADYIDMPVPFVNPELLLSAMHGRQLPWNVHGPVETYRIWDAKGEFGSRRNCISQAALVIAASLDGRFPADYVVDKLGLNANIYVRDLARNLAEMGQKAHAQGQLNGAGFDPGCYAQIATMVGG